MVGRRVGVGGRRRDGAGGQRGGARTCPQTPLHTERGWGGGGRCEKRGPPLRPADGPDRGALWQGVEQGFVSTVASDHAPRAPEAKEPGRKNIFVDPQGRPIPFGAPSLETLATLVYSEGVAKRELPITWMARVLAENPARIFGLYPRKGVIRVGADADLTIWDPEPAWTIQRTQHLGIAGFTPYEGWAVRGRAWMTLLRGQTVLGSDGAIEQKPGYGRFLARGRPQAPVAGAAR